MKFINKMERKFGRLAIPGLMKYIIILNILGAFLGLISPEFYYSFLSLDFGKVLQGQVWRLVTFILVPRLSSSFGGFVNPVNIFFLAIEYYLYFMIGNSLENAWGAFRFNLYYLSGFLLNIVAGLIFYFAFGEPYTFGLTYINQSLFLAFAALYPNMQLMLFFVLPIKVKWLGIFYGVMLGWDVMSHILRGQYYLAIAIVAAMANFLIFFFSTRNYRKISPGEYRRKSNYRRQVRNASSITRHKCAVCGRTEDDDENLEFRFCSKCEGNYEYCSDHLFTHEHVHKH